MEDAFHIYFIRFWPKRSDGRRLHVHMNPLCQLLRRKPVGTWGEKGSFRRDEKAFFFVQTICSYEWTACRRAWLRTCTDRQANADWPTLPSNTHASRPRRPEGQVNNSGQITEYAFKYRQKISGVIFNDTHQSWFSSKKGRNIYHRLRHS